MWRLDAWFSGVARAVRKWRQLLVSPTDPYTRCALTEHSIHVSVNLERSSMLPGAPASGRMVALPVETSFHQVQPDQAAIRFPVAEIREQVTGTALAPEHRTLGIGIYRIC